MSRRNSPLAPASGHVHHPPKIEVIAATVSHLHGGLVDRSALRTVNFQQPNLFNIRRSGSHRARSRDIWNSDARGPFRLVDSS